MDPWHGSGRDVLNLRLLDWQDSTRPRSEVATENAAGILDHAPAVKVTFTEVRRDHFLLNLTDPVFAHLTCRPGYGIPPAAPGPPRPANRVLNEERLVDAVRGRNRNAQFAAEGVTPVSSRYT
jgi:hypothetical protein